MSSVSGLNSSFSLDQLTASKGSGSTQGTDSAKSAFAALLATTLAQQSSAQSAGQDTASGGQSSVSADMATLGKALASGNLSAAQQAFQALHNDLGGGVDSTRTHPHHHHHHLASGTSATTDAGTQAASATAVPATSAASGSQLLSLLMGMA